MLTYLSLDKPLSAIKVDAIILGVYGNKILPPITAEADNLTGGLISRLLKNGDLRGELKDVRILYQPQGLNCSKLVLVGLGPIEDCQAKQLIQANQVGLGALNQLPVKSLLTTLNTLFNATQSTEMTAFIRQFIVGIKQQTYRFDSYQSIKKPLLFNLETCYLMPQLGLETAIKEGLAISEGLYLAKDLANTPCNVCHPGFLADTATELARLHPKIKTLIHEKEALQTLKMGGILAVGQGSAEPPRLIEMTYQGGVAGDPPIILVGKGVTFDTGGISLKPAPGMEDMKYDMAGAAAVIGTLKSIALLNLPINVIGLVPTAENMPDGQSYRPGDILTTASGQTVEVVNTDAEGRLLLCDALTYAERFQPKAVIDIATLTGAMVVSLGYLYNGVFSKDKALGQHLVEAGDRSLDLAWPMPLVDEYQDALKSHVADMINASKLAGAITAACFLARFAKNYPWAHIDCAGTAMPADHLKAQGATGRPLPLLVEYLIHVAHSG